MLTIEIILVIYKNKKFLNGEGNCQVELNLLLKSYRTTKVKCDEVVALYENNISTMPCKVF